MMLVTINIPSLPDTEMVSKNGRVDICPQRIDRQEAEYRMDHPGSIEKRSGS